MTSAQDREHTSGLRADLNGLMQQSPQEELVVSVGSLRGFDPGQIMEFANTVYPRINDIYISRGSKQL